MHSGTPVGADPEGGGYARLRELRRGERAIVYRARSTATNRAVGEGREVAVVVFRASMPDDDLRSRFVRDCRRLAETAGDPHLLPLLDCGFTEAGQPFVVTAFRAGGSVGRRLERLGPRPLDEVLTVGIAVAAALDAAHARGIVHRDVTPRRVLVGADGEVWLTGFDIGSLPGTGPAGRHASPEFAAPEAITDYAVAGPAADLHGLGATLYAMLTGVPPVRRAPGEADLPFLLRAVSGPEPVLPAAVPAAVAEIVASCLSKSPAQRPVSARQVRRRLREAATALGVPVTERLDLTEAPITAPPVLSLEEEMSRPLSAKAPVLVPVEEPVTERPRRRRLAGIAVATVATVAIAAGAAAAFGGVPGLGRAAATANVASTLGTVPAGPAEAAPLAAPATTTGGTSTAAATPSPPAAARTDRCGGQVDRFGRLLQPCMLRRDVVPVYATPDWGDGAAEIGTIAGDVGWFAGQDHRSAFAEGSEGTTWWAYGLADNGRWGWVPILYLSRNPGDAPYRGLLSCSDPLSTCTTEG